MLFHVMHLATHEGMGAALVATVWSTHVPTPEFPERDEKSLKNEMKKKEKNIFRVGQEVL